MYLLDTNVCIDFARARSDRLRERIETSFDRGLALSAITLAELRVGASRSSNSRDNERLLELLIHALELHDFDSPAAEYYGEIARRVGVRRHSFDRLIAAHAASLDLTLVTSDVRGFADVPGLKVEDWTQ